MYNKILLKALVCCIILTLGGCKIADPEPIKNEAETFSLEVETFKAAKDFALGKKSAADLQVKFDQLNADPKRLQSLLAMKVNDDDTLKDFGILHLLSQGKASHSVASILEKILTVSADPQKVLKTKAQGKTPFELLRDTSSRPQDERKDDNLSVVQVFIGHDTNLINDNSLSFSDKNHLFLGDTNKTAVLFNAMDAKNIATWENAALSDSHAVQNVFSAVMQHIGAKKTTYKNRLFTQALGTASDHSDNKIAGFIEEFFSHGFTMADLTADDFSFNQGPNANLLAAYAYALKDINDDHPEERRLFVATVEAFKKHFSRLEDYNDFVRSDSVKGTLYDPTKTNAFSGVNRAAIKSPGDAFRVLQLKDSERKLDGAFRGREKKVAQWALSNASDFKEAFLKISDPKRQQILRGLLLDEAHNTRAVEVFVDNLAAYGFAPSDNFELINGNGHLLEGPLLYVFSKRVVLAKQNNGDDVVYETLNKVALKYKKNLATYVDHVTKAKYGSAQETILNLLEEALGSAHNIKPGYPSYAQWILDLPQEVDATLLLAASAAPKVSIDKLQWLYDALIVKAGAPSAVMAQPFSELVTKKHGGHNFVHLIVEKAVDAKSLSLVKSFLTELHVRAEAVAVSSGFGVVQDLLFVENKHQKTALNLLLVDRSTRVPQDDPLALTSLIVELIKRGSNPRNLNEHQLEKTLLILDAALTLPEKTKVMQAELRQLSSPNGRGQVFYSDTAKVDLWLKGYALKNSPQGFAALFSSNIEDSAKAMLKNRLLSLGLDYEKLVEDHEAFKLTIADLKKADFISTINALDASTLLAVMTEAKKGAGLKKFAQVLNEKAFAATMASSEWQNYVAQILHGKTAAEHAAPAFVNGKDDACKILGIPVVVSSLKPPTKPPVTPSPSTPLATPSPSTPLVTPSPSTPLVTPSPSTPLVTPSPSTPPVMPSPSTPLATPSPSTPLATPSPSTPLATPSPSTPLATPSPSTPLVTPSRSTPLVTPSPSTPLVTPSPSTPLATPSPSTPLATPSPSTPLVTPSPSTPLVTPSPSTPLATPSPSTPLVTPSPSTPLVTPSPSTPQVTPTTTPTPQSTTPVSSGATGQGLKAPVKNTTFSARFAFFKSGQHAQQSLNNNGQSQQLANEAAQLGQGSVSKAKESLQKLWNTKALENPARDLPVPYVRNIIDMNDQMHKIGDIVAVETLNKANFNPLQNQYDANGLELKAFFKGIIPGSSLVRLLNDAGKKLEAMSLDELSFLVSQKYFWTEVLSNLPHIFSCLSPEQIAAVCTAVANKEHSLTDEVALVLPRLIAHLDIENDPLILEKIKAIVPAANIADAVVEDRLREKITALKKNAFLIQKDEGRWHDANAQVQRLDYIASERKARAKALNPTQRDFDNAQSAIMELLNENNPVAFKVALESHLPSNADNEVGDALLLLSNDYHQRKDLMFMLSAMQIEGIFDVLFGRGHQRTDNQTQLAINLIRALDPAEPYFVNIMKGILLKLDEIKNYPLVPEDLHSLESVLSIFQGSINGSIKRYDQKSPFFDMREKFQLLDRFQFIQKRLSQWKKHCKDKNNQALLDSLKGREPKPLVAPSGGFGINAKVEDALLIPNWFDSPRAQKWLSPLKGSFVVLLDPQELQEARSFLAEVCSQAAFLSSAQLLTSSVAFKAILIQHGGGKTLLDFIYILNSEHEVATLFELIPDDMLGELVKYLNVADNVALSVFKHIEKLSVFITHYLRQEQFDLLINDAKWWELMGAQAAAAALGLSPDAFAALTEHVAQKRAYADEGNLARMIAKLDIQDAASADAAYERLMSAATFGKGLKAIEKQIMEKTNALRQHLAHDAANKVKALKIKVKALKISLK